jgi:small subunit ribosomal protein S17
MSESVKEQEATAPEAQEPTARRQVKTGTVVSNKMDKTVVVAVERRHVHRVYHRGMKRTSKFHAHDEGNQCNIGDVVSIVSCRPLSKSKRWRVSEIVKRAE